MSRGGGVFIGKMNDWAHMVYTRKGISVMVVSSGPRIEVGFLGSGGSILGKVKYGGSVSLK